MIGSIIVAFAVFALVAIYIGIVNWFLRSDEHWIEAPIQSPKPASANASTPASVLSPAKA